MKGAAKRRAPAVGRLDCAIGYAIFDVDHTVTRHSTGRRLVQYGMRAGLFGFADLVRLPRLYLQYRAGTIKIDSLSAKIGRVEGHAREELEAVAASCLTERIVGDVMREARELIAEHRARGHTVIFATSSLDLVVEPLARMMGVDHVVATRLEFRHGVASGAVEGRPCFGGEKLRRTRELLDSLGGSMEGSVFYSDSHLDVPLLEAVRRPVAVNPDATLRRIARERDWEILRFR